MARKVERPASEPPVLTRKQLSRAEREERTRRRILMGAAVLFGLVLVILAGGIVYSQVIEPNSPVARVGDETITTREYRQRVNLDRWRIRNAIGSVQAQAAQISPDDPSSQFINQFVTQQLQQLQQQYSFVGSAALESMIEERLIRQQAEELGLTVTDEEVTEEIERQIAGQLGAIRPADATATATAAAEATATAASWTPTPVVEPEVAVEGEAVAVEEEIALEGEEAVVEGEEPVATPTLAPTATPNILSDEAFTEQYVEYTSAMREATGITEAQYREMVRLTLLREKVSEHFAAQVPIEQEQVQISRLQLPTEEEARAALEEIRAGSSFEEVAQEIAAEDAGDLGLISRGATVPEFEEVAFSLEPGELSEPVQTQYGWHIIQVLEREGEGDEMQVRARHILVETEEEAVEIRSQLEEGADFGTLAIERSIDPGAQPAETDLGWVTRESTAAAPAVIEAAFELEPGEISEPIETPDGQWVIVQTVDGPEVRPLDEATLENLRVRAFETWLNEAKASATVERLWDSSKVPPDPFAQQGF